MADAFLLGRGKDFCRGCNGLELFSVLDLGELPIANELWATRDEPKEVFPLHLRICPTCGLGQVEDVVTPTRLFRDYRYLSSISTSFVEHARIFAIDSHSRLGLQTNDWVLEIASNDGYLLKHFRDMGIQVLGIEPAENVAQIASDAGISTVSEFFCLDLAQQLVEKYGHPRLIVANNVMAHVPDLQDFISGLAAFAGPHTVISIENPSLMNLIINDQFDTIYHEHFSYLTAYSVSKIVEPFGLELFDLQQIATHGGSNRYWLRLRSNSSPREISVQNQIGFEITSGLLDKNRWREFAARVQLMLRSFHDWLEDSFQQGKKVFGYGAAAKASTLINGARIRKEWIVAIADGSHEKQGRFLPIDGIPIISPQEMFDSHPTDVVIFPWNIQKELIQEIENGRTGSTRVWRAIPKLEQIG